MTMIALIIIMTAAAVVAITGLCYASRQNQKLNYQIKEKDAALRRYRYAENDPKPIYMVGEMKSGAIAVIRASTYDDHVHVVLIKQFNDPDKDFARLLAEELVDKLNEK